MRRAALFLLSLAIGGCGDDSDSGTASVGTTVSSDSCTGAANCTTTTPSTSSGESTGAGTTSAGSASTSTSGSSTTTGDDGETSMGTFNPITESGVEGDSTASADCSMTPDCASCWACAKAGPCNAGYASCMAAQFCIPSLICSEGCADDGLMQDCVSTCCMSCTDLMTCQSVDAVISCIEGECATQCGMVSCP